MAGADIGGFHLQETRNMNLLLIELGPNSP
ncbi:uncharacterized protein METZ01_LOCUS216725 [marine metagenome]|uniref:Uncharacterized protein n=1 Tax=marine metagenome TaxID=408172 RepID=A0A382FPG9_9ZZZZ